MLKKNKKLAFGTSKKPGMSFLEILVVLLIVGLMGAVVAPLLQPRVPAERRKEFIAHLNSLTRQAWQGAVMASTLHRVWFDLRVNKIVIEKLKEAATDLKSAQSYEPATHLYGSNNFIIPEEFNLTQFVVDGVVETGGGKPLETVWFYIGPDGSMQEILLSFSQAIDDTVTNQFSILLNPFTGQFTTYETAQSAA